MKRILEAKQSAIRGPAYLAPNTLLPVFRRYLLRPMLLGAVSLLLLLLVACASEETPTAAIDTVEPTQIIQPTETPTTPAEDTYALARQAMVKDGVIGWGVTDPAVVEVMGTVPRHKFVPEEYQALAYENHPLPIGFGQTISQPYIVALMTQSLGVSEDDRVLEIGTGSGYQAAVLAELVDHVYTIEIIGALAERAQATLESQGYDNVTVVHADGYFGWEEQGPFDAIIVTAAPDHIPQPLVQQLKIGGKMIIPVGPVGGFQTLWSVTRTGEEEVSTENLGGVRFVPFTRQER